MSDGFLWRAKPATVRRVLDEDPVGSVAWSRRGSLNTASSPRPSAVSSGPASDPIESLCYAGPNLIPLRGGTDDMYAFADKAMSTARRCSSLVGRAEMVIPMWQRLEHAWGAARDVREHQPLMALSTPPVCAMDPAVRQVRADELDAYLVAAIDMFIGEVGIDPRIGDGGRGYRRRVAGLIAAGRAWARFERGQVIFKAEVGSQSPSVGQIQGVWVHPDWRGHGIGTAGTATLASAVVRSGRTASLYVNSFNTVARATYDRIGFHAGGHVRDRSARLTRRPGVRAAPGKCHSRNCASILINVITLLRTREYVSGYANGSKLLPHLHVGLRHSRRRRR